MIRARIVLTRLIITIAFALSFIAISYSYSFAQAQDCSLVPGSHAATAADVPLMIAAGIPNAQVGWCWNPADKDVGQAAGEAKEYLKQHSTTAVNVSCFNADFAEKLKKLMQSVPGGPPTITDGYRTPEDQQKALASGASKVGACGSYHQYGMAADFNNTNKQTLQWMRVNASQFGLAPVTYANPATGCTPNGFCDYGHIQNGTSLPPQNQCGQCSGAGSNGILPPSSGGAASTPTSALSNMIRGMISPPMMQPAQPIQQQQLMPPPPQYQQTGGTAPNGSQMYYDRNGQPYYYNSAGQAISATTGQPINPSQTQSQTQTNSGQTTTDSTNPNSYQINSGLPNAQNTSTNGNGAGQIQINPSNFNSTSSNSTGGNGTSDIDFINSLANSLAPAGSNTGGTHPATGTNTPAQLNTTVTQNVQGSQNGAQYTGANGQNANGYILPSVMAPEFQQTFGSPNTTGDLTYSADPASTFQQILTRLKAVLIKVSVYLTPFGGRAQAISAME